MGSASAEHRNRRDSASLIRVPRRAPAASSTAVTALRSVVIWRATVGFLLKKTTESGCPGLRAANARAAFIAESIDPFMLFDESIRRTVPIPSAEADERTLRFFTGLPPSVTFTSPVVSAEPRGWVSVRTTRGQGGRFRPRRPAALVGRGRRDRGDDRRGRGRERGEARGGSPAGGRRSS
jgi:hypothetical protein